jgi:hypothetical protein
MRRGGGLFASMLLIKDTQWILFRS